jgi:4a-hydroxytetrahydrobiopterin dehydratase
MKGKKVGGSGAKDDAVRLSAEKMARDHPGWQIGEGEIVREFSLGSFRSAIEFVDRVADLAEEEEHHPDIFVFYNKVRLVLSTHKAGGLSRKDFLLAARIDRMAEQEM